MGGDGHVAGFILGTMGNATKTEFLRFLADRMEKDIDVKDAVHFAVLIVNRIRENRNILEHAIPLISHDNLYHGDLVKLDKKSNFVPFSAPIKTVKDVAASAARVKGWLRAVRTCAYMVSLPKNHEPKSHGMTTAEASKIWLSSQNRPPLPHKISPLELEEAPTNEKRPRQPSRV